jgi:hypothetical protein
MNTTSPAVRILIATTVVFTVWVAFQYHALDDWEPTVYEERVASPVYIILVPTSAFYSLRPTDTPTWTPEPTKTPRPSCEDPGLAMGSDCWKATVTPTITPTPTRIPTPAMYPTPRPTPTPPPTWPGPEDATPGRRYSVGSPTSTPIL